MYPYSIEILLSNMYNQQHLATDYVFTYSIAMRSNM
ncbi:hypothetical protein SLEP1_g49588 [Rubroshorea leprosula]|uniref:Uncharacterized protein n=1 Tax=Rubroshorea leprosula TaxID=152421 RepID=A0AAV5LXL0_9ROSI|nr:hypothetical protein SLEP1_g49588 [Rubroshorea leprosula]